METLNTLDRITQFRLTGAIQKAASQALASDEDRSEILAKQLELAGIPKNLTKIAAHAFNRRISVVTLGRRKDDTKADDFPLADVNKVEKLRGCKTQLDKTASISSTGFVFQVQPRKMLKRQFSTDSRKFELTPQKLLMKLQSIVEKRTAEIETQEALLRKNKSILEDMVKEASKRLTRNVRLGSQLATIYGSSYTELFKDKVPAEALHKYAAYVILPKSADVEFIENTLKQADLVKVKTNMFQRKIASAEMMLKEVEEIENKVRDQRLKGLSKTAEGGYSILKDIGSNIISVPLYSALHIGEGAASQFGSAMKQLSPYFNPAYAANPSKVISRSLINSDLYQDKKLRLVDMLSNPDFAGYPAREIEKATEDSIAANPSFTRPRMKEYLKNDVNTRLLNNNRVSRADLAAQAMIMEKVFKANEKQRELRPETMVEGLPGESTEGKSLPGLLPSLTEAIASSKNRKVTSGEFGKHFEEMMKNFKTDIEQNRAQQEQKYEEVLKTTEDYMERRQKALTSLLVPYVKRHGIQCGLTRKQIKQFNSPKDLFSLSLPDQEAVMRGLETVWGGLPIGVTNSILNRLTSNGPGGAGQSGGHKNPKNP